MKASRAALAAAREIHAGEGVTSDRIIATAQIIDRHTSGKGRLKRLLKAVNTTDSVADIRDPVRDARNSEEPSQ